MLTDFARQSLAAVRILIVFTIGLGLGYPLTVWAVAQAFGDRAAGQPVMLDGRLVGSALIGQEFHGDKWFHGRPAVSGYDPLASGGSNLGPSNPVLIGLIDRRRAEVAAMESVAESAVPADAVTASGSGLDPQISPAYAALQAPRVARANGLPTTEVTRLIRANTEGRSFGYLGEPAVNVLQLNIGIDRTSANRSAHARDRVGLGEKEG